MLVQVAELVKETEKCYVVKVFDFDESNTNFPKSLVDQVDTLNYELSGFIKRVVAKHLAKHGALEVA